MRRLLLDIAEPVICFPRSTGSTSDEYVYLLPGRMRNGGVVRRRRGRGARPSSSTSNHSLESLSVCRVAAIREYWQPLRARQDTKGLYSLFGCRNPAVEPFFAASPLAVRDIPARRHPILTHHHDGPASDRVMPILLPTRRTSNYYYSSHCVQAVLPVVKTTVYRLLPIGSEWQKDTHRNDTRYSNPTQLPVPRSDLLILAVNLSPCSSLARASSTRSRSLVLNLDKT